MLLTAEAGPAHSPATQLTNRVIKALSLRGSRYKAFGENVILLLNRESKHLDFVLRVLAFQLSYSLPRHPLLLPLI